MQQGELQPLDWFDSESENDDADSQAVNSSATEESMSSYDELAVLSDPQTLIDRALEAYEAKITWEILANAFHEHIGLSWNEVEAAEEVYDNKLQAYYDAHLWYDQYHVEELHEPHELPKIAKHWFDESSRQATNLETFEMYFSRYVYSKMI